jgi:VWFA-related protein
MLKSRPGMQNRMCKTRVMRPALILFVCAAFLQVAFAQAPGTVDPSKVRPDNSPGATTPNGSLLPPSISTGPSASQPSSSQPTSQPAASQQPQAPPDDSNITFRSGATVVIAPTTVRDRNGDYVNGLQLQDFQLYDNNRLQKINADVRDEPLSLVVAVQRSSNLTDFLPKVQLIGTQLNQLVAGQDGEIAVVGFDHRMDLFQDFTKEGSKISEAMHKMTPGSSEHAVNDVVNYSINLLKHRPPDRRRVLLLIAEKRDKGSELRLREALEAAQFANVSIYSLDISTVVSALTAEPIPPRPSPVPPEAEHLPGGYANTPTLQDQNTTFAGNYVPVFVDIFKAVKSIFVDDTLDVFTRFTGGREYSFIGEKSLNKAIEGISEELHSQYLLSYSPNDQTEGGFHDIKVIVNRPNLEVRTRPGYWVAAKPE